MWFQALEFAVSCTVSKYIFYCGRKSRSSYTFRTLWGDQCLDAVACEGFRLVRPAWMMCLEILIGSAWCGLESLRVLNEKKVPGITCMPWYKINWGEDLRAPTWGYGFFLTNNPPHCCIYTTRCFACVYARSSRCHLTHTAVADGTTCKPESVVSSAVADGTTCMPESVVHIYSAT